MLIPTNVDSTKCCRSPVLNLSELNHGPVPGSVNISVRTLGSFETVANASVVCTDKTNTLTWNVMSVVAGSLRTHAKCVHELQDTQARTNMNEDRNPRRSTYPKAPIQVVVAGARKLLVSSKSTRLERTRMRIGALAGVLIQRPPVIFVPSAVLHILLFHYIALAFQPLFNARLVYTTYKQNNVLESYRTICLNDQTEHYCLEQEFENIPQHDASESLVQRKECM